MVSEWLISVDDHVVEHPTSGRAVCRASTATSRHASSGAPRGTVSGLTKTSGGASSGCRPLSVATRTTGALRRRTTTRYIRRDDERRRHPGAGQLPDLPRFCGQAFADARDKDLAVLCVPAWNDHVIDDWCSQFPGPLPATVDGADVGCEPRRGRNGAGHPARGAGDHVLGERCGAEVALHPRQGRLLAPLIAVANETGLPICMHTGSSSNILTTAAEAPSIIRGGVRAGGQRDPDARDWTACRP